MNKGNAEIFLTGSSLKWLAILAMFINHFGDTVLKGIIMNAPYSAFSDAQFAVLSNFYVVFHAIGRISMPIFCFLIVEGYIHTHDVKGYFRRLGLFALISEIPYDLAFGNTWIDFNQQNVFFTLTLGLLVLLLIDKFKKMPAIAVMLTLILSMVAYYLKFDGSYYGIIMIALFYVFRNQPLLKCIGVIILQIAILLVFREQFDLNSILAMTPLIPIYLYNGKRGMGLKYFFYIFYPAHLLILGLITKVIVIPFFIS